MAENTKEIPAGGAEDDLQELESEIRRIIEGNRKFLDRMLDDDFEPDDEPEEEEPVVEEL